MLRVIDTIRYDEYLLQKMPELAERFGRGLFVILDPAQVTTAPVQPGITVRVHRPDGSVFERVVAAVDVQHSVVGLFFRDTVQHEIPRLSQIESPAA